MKSNRDIVIKEEDKGSAVVVWGIENYRKKAYILLGNEKVYEVVERGFSEEVSNIDRRLKILNRKGRLLGII